MDSGFPKMPVSDCRHSVKMYNNKCTRVVNIDRPDKDIDPLYNSKLSSLTPIETFSIEHLTFWDHEIY